MQNLDLSKVNNVHFVGIGGIGISAIARMFLAEGKNISGQDIQDSEIVKSLKDLGAKILIGQSFENIPKDTDLIIYTIAIEYYDKDLFDKLKNQDIEIRSYPEMLGIISMDKYTIAVCGTHGKTTTTGMISKILIDNKKDPTVILGSLIKINERKQTNFVHGDSDLFVVEACEYRRSFLNINPDIVIITNIDLDHLDYYKDIEDIKNAFREFLLKVKEGGYVVCDIEDENIYDVVKDLKVNVVNYKEFFDNNLKLKIPGNHNRIDGAMALTVANILKIEKEDAIKALKEFSGTWRRFEYKGELSNGVKVYDDYAHHPKEIVSTLQAFRELYKKEEGYHITVIFQAHLFSRTKLLLDDFSKSFYMCDSVCILPIYFAREVNDGTISEEILADSINIYSKNAQSFSSFLDLENYIEENIKNMGEKNIIVTMGAGEAYKIAEKILK